MNKDINEILGEVLKVKDRNSEDEEIKFLNLLAELYGRVDLKVARTLMKTFLQKPDYGTQERVISTILSGGREIYIRAVLEALPMLNIYSKRWVDCLILPEVENYRDIFQKLVIQMPDSVKTILRDLFSNEEVIKEYPCVENIKL